MELDLVSASIKQFELEKGIPVDQNVCSVLNQCINEYIIEVISVGIMKRV